VNEVSSVNLDKKVTIAARVPPDLADAVAALADAGDRTVSREVFGAIRAHVQSSTLGRGSLEARSGSSLGRGSLVDTPAERDGTSNSEAVEPARLAGGSGS
jgi:hypothetical protein